jgi:hypothetical protein
MALVSHLCPTTTAMPPPQQEYKPKEEKYEKKY